MTDFSICITMDCWKLAVGGLSQDTEEEEESVIKYPHSALPHFTHHIRR